MIQKRFMKIIKKDIPQEKKIHWNVNFGIFLLVSVVTVATVYLDPLLVDVAGVVAIQVNGSIIRTAVAAVERVTHCVAFSHRNNGVRTTTRAASSKVGAGGVGRSASVGALTAYLPLVSRTGSQSGDIPKAAASEACGSCPARGSRTAVTGFVMVVVGNVGPV